MWRLVATIAALWVVIFAPGVSSAADAGPEWRRLLPGLDFALWDAGATVRAGSEKIALLRVDPRRFAFRVLAAPPGRAGFTAEQWRHRSQALAVFNAGQYAADGTYLGLLVQDGHPRGHLIRRLEALFLAEPEEPSLPPARVLDLRYTAFDLKSNPYRQAAQSLMLLDRFGHIRVRRSPRVAHRTLVAEDSRGHILVMVTEGGHTLWELAHFLARSRLGLREVMCMDGGPESQLDLRVGGFSYQQFGSPSGTPQLLPWLPPPLPAALGVFPR